MVYFVESALIELPVVGPTQSEKTITLKGFPTFYSSTHEYLLPVNLWLNHLVNNRKIKDLNSTVRALKRYFNFLEKSELSWDQFPPSKFLRPTYRFRNDDLLANARAGHIGFSTASLYMLHIIKFYEWCLANRVLDRDDKCKPFEYEILRVRNSGMMNHLRPYYVVSSTDLRIKVPKKDNVQSMNPLSKDELVVFAQTLSLFSIEFIIHQLLQIHCGLRIQEACTFPLSVSLELAAGSYTEVEIGPFNGVKTKYDKTRKIEIPAKLATIIYNYAISERRKKRAKGKGVRYLLVTKNSTPFTSNNVHQSFHRLKKRIHNNIGTPFKHKTHDLRSTYCTYRLSSLLEYGLQKNAVMQMMAWMGHSSEATTWKYVDYLERDKTVQAATSFLDEVLQEAVYE